VLTYFSTDPLFTFVEEPLIWFGEDMLFVWNCSEEEVVEAFGIFLGEILLEK